MTTLAPPPARPDIYTDRPLPLSPSPQPVATLRLCPRRCAQVMTGLIIGLLLLSAAGQFSVYRLHHGRLWGLVRFLYVDEEGNLPTWFQSTGMAISALLLWWIGREARARKQRFAGHWTGLAGVFLLLSIDEAASFHEMLIDPLNQIMHISPLLFCTWVIAGAAFVLVMAVIYAKFMLHLPPTLRWQLLLAAALYLGGAMGMELIGGCWAKRHSIENGIYSFLTHIEEGLEMSGIAVFIHGLLRWLAMADGRLLLSASAKPDDAAPAAIIGPN